MICLLVISFYNSAVLRFLNCYFNNFSKSTGYYKLSLQLFFIGSWICDNCVAERNGKRRRPTSNVPASLLEHDDYIIFKPPIGKKGSQKRKGPANEMEDDAGENL